LANLKEFSSAFAAYVSAYMLENPIPYYKPPPPPKKKVNQSRYRPGVAQRVPGS